MTRKQVRILLKEGLLQENLRFMKDQTIEEKNQLYSHISQKKTWKKHQDIESFMKIITRTCFRIEEEKGMGPSSFLKDYPLTLIRRSIIQYSKQKIR